LPYEEEETASGEYPPIIREANPSMGFYTGGDAVPLSIASPMIFTIDVEDRNVDDDIYVRVFRDYNPTTPSPPVLSPSSPFPATGEALRKGLELQTSNWCPAPGNYLFEVIVADGPFDDAVPGYQSVVEGADSSTRSWRVQCQ